MAKIQIKYLTKPSKEALTHIEKFKNKMSEDEIRKFLEETNHFCLLIYSFGKLSSLVFLENDEYLHMLFVKKVYMNAYEDFKEVINFTKNKFINYKIVIDSTYNDSNFINVIRKNGGVKKDNNFIIQL